jgi:hypothetical protein
MAGVLPGDLTLVRRVRTPAGEEGFLVGRASGDEMWSRLAPVVGSAAWVLFIATLVFVGFGAWLLRRRVVSPLAALAAAAPVASGDLRAHRGAGRRSSPELARFNQMAESLEPSARRAAHAGVALAQLAGWRASASSPPAWRTVQSGRGDPGLRGGVSA